MDKNRFKDSDVNQKGILGDCWFLSALSSLAVYDLSLIQRVLNIEYNSRNGPTRGKLKVRDRLTYDQWIYWQASQTSLLIQKSLFSSFSTDLTDGNK